MDENPRLRRRDESRTRRVDERIQSGRFQTPTESQHTDGDVAITIKGDVVVYRENGKVTLVG